MTQKKLLGCTLALMVATAGWLYYEQASAFDVNQRIEAEAGLLQGGLKAKQEDGFSGTGFIKSTSNNHKGTATYQFYVDEPGVYKINAKVYNHAGNGDSFFVKIDDQPEMTWDLHNVRHRRWGVMPVTQRRNLERPGNGFTAEIELDAGNHTMVVRERERNSGLDYFEFQMIRPVTTASLLSGFQLSQFVQGSLALCLVALSLVAIRLSRNAGFLTRQSPPPVDARLNALEKRISDMQEIMISLDEQLRRQKKESVELADKI